MARYKINHRYLSSVIGFDEGAVVDIDDTLAEWLERDSPGVLTALDEPVADPVADPDPDAEPEAEAADDDPVEDEEPAAKPKRSRAKA